MPMIHTCSATTCVHNELCRCLLDEVDIGVDGSCYDYVMNATLSRAMASCQAHDDNYPIR